MFEAFEVEVDGSARKRLAAAFSAAAITVAGLMVVTVLIANRPVHESEAKKQVEVSFRPPPPPPEPVKIETPPPPPPVAKKPKPPPPPVIDTPVPPPAPVAVAAPAAAPMVAPVEVPKGSAPESDTKVEAINVAVGGRGDGSGVAVNTPPGPVEDDEGPAPVVATATHNGPITLPEDADPPEPNEDNAQPEYPEAARASGQEARVVLKIVVEKDGRVGRIQLLKGDEPFASAAIAAVKTWVYEPARLEDQTLAVFKIVNLTFQLRE